MKTYSVLMADDEASGLIERWKTDFAAAGLVLESEVNAEHVVKRVRHNRPDVVMLDVMFPDSDGKQAPLGIQIIRELKSWSKCPPVVMQLGALNVRTEEIAEDSFKLADYVIDKDYLSRLRPAMAREELLAIITQIRQLAERQTPDYDTVLGFYVGRTEAMLNLARDTMKFAPGSMPVLITGERGVGKEKLARAIHQLSARTGPLISCNCASFPSDDMFLSAMFGAEAGSHSTARKTSEGLANAANRGTLFLDELQGLKSTAQQAMLRFIQTGEFNRVGGKELHHVDVRFVSATNGDLRSMVHSGQFRADLLDRLKKVHLHLPPLRQRQPDITPLARHFIKKTLKDNPHIRATTEIIPSVEKKLVRYPWPGNIRELEDNIVAAVTTINANVLMPHHLSQMGSLGLHEVMSDVESNAPLLTESEPSKTTAEGHTAKSVTSVTWADLMEVKGDRRRRMLLEFIKQIQTEIGGVRPSGKLIAERLGVNRNSLAQQLLNLGIELRQF